MNDKGIDITHLEPNTQLIVETLNCIYTIEVIEPKSSKVQIAGGATFIDQTEAFIDSSVGKEECVDKCIHRGMSLVIRYINKNDGKFHTVESDAVQVVKIIGPSDDWSYTMWKKPKIKILDIQVI